MKMLANGDDFESSRQSPTLARVAEILNSQAEFWTTVVFSIDSRLTSLADATLQLKQSRNLPINIMITRRAGL